MHSKSTRINPLPQHEPPWPDWTAPLFVFVQEQTASGDIIQCPHLRCVTCGRPITQDANVMYEYSERPGELYTGRVVARHRDRPCDRMETVAWEGAGLFMHRVEHNSCSGEVERRAWRQLRRKARTDHRVPRPPS